MDADLVIVFIFIVVILISLVRKGLEKLAEQAGRAGEGAAPFEASADEIEKFLRGLGKPPGPQEQPEPPAEPAQRPARPRPERTRPLRSPQGARRARRLPRERKPAAPEPQQEAVLGRKERAGKGLASLRRAGFTLRDAVVWLEILGRPVSMRRHRHHMPPTSGQ